MHDPDSLEVFPELAALQIQEKLLRLAQLCRMNPEQKVSLIGKPSQQIQIDYHMLRTDEPVEKALGHYLTKRQTRK